MKLSRLLCLPALVALIYPCIEFMQLGEWREDQLAQRAAQLKKTSRIVSNQIEANASWLDSLIAMGTGSDGRDIFSQPLSAPIITDGKSNDWLETDSRLYDGKHNLETYAPLPASLSFKLRFGTYQQAYYLFIEVTDDTVVYREINNLSVHRNDHVEIAMEDENGQFQRYTLATHQPGDIAVFVTSSSGRALRRQADITGSWRATDAGYNIELKIPMPLLADRFAITVADVDDDEQRNIKTVVGSASTASVHDLGLVIKTSNKLEQLLANYTEGHTEGHVEIRSIDGQLLAAAGRLTGANIGASVQASSPIIRAGRILGTITISETDPSLLIQYERRRQGIFMQGVGVLILSLIICLGIAQIIQGRLRKLRLEFESAIDAQGRVQYKLNDKQLDTSDEIGELSRSLGDMVERLRQYNHYLEAMAGRLAHELRTPVSVVRSSLENLHQHPMPDEQSVYVKRAGDGVKRLTNILNKMSEATRLEHALDEDEVEKFDLAEVVAGCVEGYKLAYPAQTFIASIESERVLLTGIPDLIAQLFDKLISNAVEFSLPDSPIRIRLTSDADNAVLRVINDGPNLPAEMSENLFDSMISIRKKTTAEGSHLGLGLYIAKIITEFHGGSISAHDREDSQGVMIKVTLPLMRLTTKLKN